ncbi:MAG: Ig-like domain-containing protein [Terriglobales bacterium]
MLSGKKKLEILAASATLLLFAAGVACNGFFVNPVLTTMTIGPTATINQGGTVQESAVGTYNDGSTKSLTSVQWSSDTESVATISTSGLVTGVSPGTSTITGASGTVSGTATVTVALSNVTGITISPTTNHAQANGGTADYTALATISGGSPVDITATATWSVLSVTGGGTGTADFSVEQGVDPEVVTVESTAVAGEIATIQASYVGGSGLTYTKTATLTVTAAP